MLCTEIFALCCDNHTKYVNYSQEQKYRCRPFNVKVGGIQGYS